MAAESPGPLPITEPPPGIKIRNWPDGKEPIDDNTELIRYMKLETFLLNEMRRSLPHTGFRRSAYSRTLALLLSTVASAACAERRGAGSIAAAAPRTARMQRPGATVNP